MVRKDYKMTTVDLHPHQYKMLKVMSAQQGTPMAEIIRYAIDGYLNKHNPDYIKTQMNMRKFKENNEDTLRAMEVI